MTRERLFKVNVHLQRQGATCLGLPQSVQPAQDHPGITKRRTFLSTAKTVDPEKTKDSEQPKAVRQDDQKPGASRPRQQSVAPTDGDLKACISDVPLGADSGNLIMKTTPHKTIKFRTSGGQFSFMQSRSAECIAHPIEAGCEEGDIYVHWVTTEHRCQAWIWMDGWVRVAEGHQVMKATETEPRFLTVTEGGVLSLIRKITWDKVYKKQQPVVIPP
ncbi:hypothetical protein BDN67DRAFT_985427 [Paxillus ammoniavirescens]|nr:hypothetical protein BDN67DRAFT_985427 [Paxillus ammoniavirescens]